MRVRIKLYATLREFAPLGTDIGEEFVFNFEGKTLAELIAQLGFPEKQAKIMIVNDIRVSNLGHKLQPDDLVVVFPPVGGG